MKMKNLNYISQALFNFNIFDLLIIVYRTKIFYHFFLFYNCILRVQES